jgi:hypothetical protein
MPHLQWIAHELELLHNIRGLLELAHNSRCNDTEVLIWTADGLDSKTTRARGCDGSWIE